MGLTPEYKSFVAIIQDWLIQPSLVELENLLANQEVLVKKMAGVSKKWRGSTLAVEAKTEPIKYLMQILSKEIMKIEKMKRALKNKELKGVATIMSDNPWVTKTVMSSVSIEEKWSTLLKIVNSRGK